MSLDKTNSLQGLFTQVEGFIRLALGRVQALGISPSDALRGLVITDEDVARDLASIPMADFWEGEPPFEALFAAIHRGQTPISPLVSAFSWSLLDTLIVLLSIAPDIDRRYERLYAYLQDDVGQRRPTVGLLMNLLAGEQFTRIDVWMQLRPESPLLRYKWLEITNDPNRPNAGQLASVVKVDPYLVQWLLSQDASTLKDPQLDLLRDHSDWHGDVPHTDASLRPIQQALPDLPIILFQGKPHMGQLATATCLVGEVVAIDARRFEPLGLNPVDYLLRAIREGLVRGGGVLIHAWSALLSTQGQPDPVVWRVIHDARLPIFLCVDEAWVSDDVGRTKRILTLDFQTPDYPNRLKAWEQYTDAYHLQIPADTLAELANKYRFPQQRIALSVHSAVDLAASQGRDLSTSDLIESAQNHSALRLGHLASRVNPHASWDHLILPENQVEQLREIVSRARFTSLVQEGWGFGERIRNSNGISVLFAGESGTGKTLAAQVISRELGLAMYRIDLSSVVSKYIGETEKNLNVIFTEAQSSNAILFFDEADAIFGKRSEVKDARDRYANIEVAYLLQLIEDYDGVAILATNLRQNLDEAFTRRLDFMVDFPFPDAAYRYRIWLGHFPPNAPLDPTINWNGIAEQYRLAGGNIRNAALAAAYLAAADGGVITMTHLKHAIRREHQKMGHLLQD